MSEIRSDRSAGILTVRLARGKGNALSGSLIEELIAMVDEAAQDECIRGLILASDVPGFFSTGLDITEVFEYDRETILIVLSRFIDLYEGLYLMPKPVVAAVSGHAYAGGAMLAMTCDFRVLARGPYGFAINEVDLGLSPPPGFMSILVGAIGAGGARELLLSGEPICPERALALGIANEITEPDAVQLRALDICTRLSRKPPTAFAAIKHALRAAQGRWTTDNDPALLEQFVDMWFSPEAAEARKALAAALKSRRMST